MAAKFAFFPPNPPSYNIVVDQETVKLRISSDVQQRISLAVELTLLYIRHFLRKTDLSWVNTQSILPAILLIIKQAMSSTMLEEMLQSFRLLVYGLLEKVYVSISAKNHSSLTLSIMSVVYASGLGRRYRKHLFGGRLTTRRMSWS